MSVPQNRPEIVGSKDLLAAHPHAIEWLVVATAVGLVAVFAAPWLELRGTFQSWRIVEWHTFWRGEGAFQLADLVAPGYRLPVEFATPEMQATMRSVSVAAAALGLWHLVVLFTLLAVGARSRARQGVPAWKVALATGGILLVNLGALYFIAVLLALPSSLSMKVDFRGPADLHVDSLVWSDLGVLPAAPVMASAAAAVEMLVIARVGWQRAISRSR